MDVDVRYADRQGFFKRIGMPEPYTTQRMLSLRKLTRAAADQMRHQLKDILSAVGPLLQPKAALGDYVRGVKDPVRGADALFKEIESMYHAVAAEKPFGVRRELTPPLDFSGSSVDVNPLEYSHTAAVKGHSKRVMVTSPFKWVLSYSGHSAGGVEDVAGRREPRQRPAPRICAPLRYDAVPGGARVAAHQHLQSSAL